MGLALAWALGRPLPAWGIPANPNPVEVKQPGGNSIKLRVRGDERLSWQEDVNGFPVLEDRGRFVYATLNPKGSLIPTPWVVGTDNPKAVGLTAHLVPSLDQPSNSPLRPGASNGPSVPAAAPARSGTLKNLVVLCKFSDQVFGFHTRPEADYEVLLNSVGGDPILAPSGSVRDFYRENSYGTLSLESTVAVWVTLPHLESYYANGSSGLAFTYPNNAQGMVEDALKLVDPLVNFADFDTDNDGWIDAITIIHSGYGAEWGGTGFRNRIWSHRWSLWALPLGYWVSSHTNARGVPVKVYDYHTEPALWSTSGNDITHIGVICHETGHFLGLPDLYDTDGTSQGIGSYCLMANAWGFDNTQYHPPHMSAWCKTQMGWAVPLDISPGVFSAPQAEFNPAVYRMSQGYPAGEYLLIENRQPAGFEADMPQGGLAIWHIDEGKADNTSEGYPGQAGWPGNNKHYRVALLPADGLYEMERNLNRGNAGDLYREGGVSTLSQLTVPNSQAYQNGVIITNFNMVSYIGPSDATMSFSYLYSQPSVIADTATVVAENYLPWNGFVEPGETVTLNLALKNLGVSTVSLTATLLETNGATAPSGPQNYGVVLALGPTVSRSFTLTATGTCGGLIVATLMLNDNGTDLGTVSFPIRLGVPRITYAEDFSEVTPPALPAGWTSQTLDPGSGWTTVDTVTNTPRVMTLVTDPGSISDNSLISPPIAVPLHGAQLAFKHFYSFEPDYDGGVLELAVNGDPNFVDILAAGGSFVTNGYDHVLLGTNPLAGRNAWSGVAAGFLTTIVALPASAAGQTVQFRWRSVSDASISGNGWLVGNITITDFQFSGTTNSPTPNLALRTSYPSLTGTYAKNLQLLQDGLTNYTSTTGFGYTVWTNANGPGSMVMDLQRQVTVQSNRLLLVSLAFMPRWYQYRLESSTNGGNWVLLAERTTSVNPGWEIPAHPAMQARYLRLTGLYSSVGTVFPVAEWEVYGTSEGYPASNLAVAPEILGSNGRNWSLLNDGLTNAKTTTGFGYTIWTNATGPGWMKLDLRRLCAISDMNLLLYFLGPNDNRYFQYTIESSTNNQDWQLVVDARHGEHRGWQRTSFTSPLRTRYLKLTGLDSSADSLFRAVEWQTFGAFIDPSFVGVTNSSPALPSLVGLGLSSVAVGPQLSVQNHGLATYTARKSIALRDIAENMENPGPPVIPPRLQLISPSELILRGERGVSYRIEGTAALESEAEWTLVTLATLTDSNQTIIRLRTKLSLKFYRALVQP